MKLIRQKSSVILYFLIIIGVLPSNYTDASDSDGKFVNPVIIYPETVIICFMPFDISGGFEAHRKEMTDILKKHGDFNYNFILPEKGQVDKIYTDGFDKIDDKQRFTQLYQKYEYWKKTDIQYVIFGYYKAGNNILLEIFLYDVRGSVMSG